MIKDHKDHLDDTKPSEEFMTALKELKPIWRDDAGECDLEVMQKKYNSLIALGKREGLSSDFVNSKLDERIVNCQVCNQEVITYRSDDPLCPKCDDKQKRQEWKESQKQAKQEEDPIERYCNTIRGITPDYEISYEESVKMQEENWNYTKKKIEKIEESWNKPMEGMTKAEQKEERRKRRLVREERKQLESDRNLKYRGTPLRLLSERIDKIGCECEAEQMRQGRFCDTCKLLVKVNDYILDLFKRESEGRGTII